VRSIEGPNQEASEVECTTFDSTGFAREYLLGLSDPGNMTVELAFDPQDAGQQIVLNLQSSRRLAAFKIVFPTTGHTITGTGYVNSFGPSFPVDNLVTASVGIRVSGPITWPSTV
jgi:hypothetical protein